MYSFRLALAAAYLSWSDALDSSSSSYSGYVDGTSTVTIDAGVLYGTSTSLPAATASVNKFLGIPFAKNPPERFSPPERPASFSAPLNATTFGPSCHQLISSPNIEAIYNTPAPVESEACLYLNVFAPSTPAPSDGRAVLVWIYGGSFQLGNAGQPEFDGSSFASYEDVIVVTFNYRTNVFGFPSSTELPSTARNLGFLDQRLALDWVQGNIHVFGGSANKVTIFGESAGAYSIDALLTSYPADTVPPFRAAILQSGQVSYRDAPFRSYEASWATLSEALGCPGQYSSNLTCLRAANASLIDQTINEKGIIFYPSPDNLTLHQNPAAQRLNGNTARVPVLGGTNADEGRLFTVLQPNTTSLLQSFFPGDQETIDSILAAYAIGTPGIASEYDQSSQIFTDYYFQCSAKRWAEDIALTGAPAWRYYFNASFVNTQPYSNTGATHGSEIKVIFGTYPPAQVTTQEYALSETLRGIWARFAKNPERGPGWNQIGTGGRGSVLAGFNTNTTGGILTGSNGTIMLHGNFNLAVLGTRGPSLSSGVTVIDQDEVDFRCGLYDSSYDANII